MDIYRIANSVILCTTDLCCCSDSISNVNCNVLEVIPRRIDNLEEKKVCDQNFLKQRFLNFESKDFDLRKEKKGQCPDFDDF